MLNIFNACKSVRNSMRVGKINSQTCAITAYLTGRGLGTTQITTGDNYGIPSIGIVLGQMFAKFTCATYNNDGAGFIHGCALPYLVFLRDISSRGGNDRSDGAAVAAPESLASAQFPESGC